MAAIHCGVRPVSPNTCLPLSLHGERSASQDRAVCAVQGKTLFNREGDEGLGLGLGYSSLAAVETEQHRKVQGKSAAKRVRQLLGEAERLLAPLQGLVWISKEPQ